MIAHIVIRLNEIASHTVSWPRGHFTPTIRLAITFSFLDRLHWLLKFLDAIEAIDADYFTLIAISQNITIREARDQLSISAEE